MGNSTSDLNLGPKPHISDEKAFVGFDGGGEGRIVWATSGVSQWCKGENDWTWSSFQSSQENTPNFGFWVWEGTLETRYEGNLEHEGWETYVKGTWRMPTGFEWAQFGRTENPWEPDMPAAIPLVRRMTPPWEERLFPFGLPVQPLTQITEQKFHLIEKYAEEDAERTLECVKKLQPFEDLGVLTRPDTKPVPGSILHIPKGETVRVSFVCTIRDIKHDSSDPPLPGFYPLEGTGTWRTVVVVWPLNKDSYIDKKAIKTDWSVRTLIVDSDAYRKFAQLHLEWQLDSVDIKLTGGGQPGPCSSNIGLFPCSSNIYLYLQQAKDSPLHSAIREEVFWQIDKVLDVLDNFERDPVSCIGFGDPVHPLLNDVPPAWTDPLLGPQPISVIRTTPWTEPPVNTNVTRVFLSVLREHFPQWDWADRSLDLYSGSKETFLAQGLQGSFI